MPITGIHPGQQMGTPRAMGGGGGGGNDGYASIKKTQNIRTQGEDECTALNGVGKVRILAKGEVRWKQVEAWVHTAN